MADDADTLATLNSEIDVFENRQRRTTTRLRIATRKLLDLEEIFFHTLLLIRHKPRQPAKHQVEQHADHADGEDGKDDVSQ